MSSTTLKISWLMYRIGWHYDCKHSSGTTGSPLLLVLEHSSEDEYLTEKKAVDGYHHAFASGAVPCPLESPKDMYKTTLLKETRVLIYPSLFGKHFSIRS